MCYSTVGKILRWTFLLLFFPLRGVYASESSKKPSSTIPTQVLQPAFRIGLLSEEAMLNLPQYKELDPQLLILKSPLAKDFNRLLKEANDLQEKLTKSEGILKAAEKKLAQQRSMEITEELQRLQGVMQLELKKLERRRSLIFGRMQESWIQAVQESSPEKVDVVLLTSKVVFVNPNPSAFVKDLTKEVLQVAWNSRKAVDGEELESPSSDEESSDEESSEALELGSMD